MDQTSQESDTHIQNLKVFWSIADKWFRIIEFSLVLGTLYYFKDKTGSIQISVIYWISWSVFYIWVLEIGDFLGAFIIENVLSKKKLNRNQKAPIWLISSSFVVFIYFLITEAVKVIVSKS